MNNNSFHHIFYIILIVLFSCGNNSTNIKFNDFNTIELLKYNKKKVKFKTSFNLLNDSDENIIILNSDFDVIINGIDIASHINTEPITIVSKKMTIIPIVVEFDPAKVFSDFEAGISKIKSDIVADVEIIGIIKTKNEETEYSSKQKMLFTNNNKLILNEQGEIIQK